MKPFLSLLAVLVPLLVFSCKGKTGGESTSVDALANSPASGTAYQIDAARSELKWLGSKPTGTHYGIVPISGGTIYLQGDLLTGGTVEINMAQLQVQGMEGEYKENLESHLRGTRPGKENDFFNVNQYPKATYVIKSSSKIENDPSATHLVEGELTIKDITKPLAIRAKVDLAAGDAIKVTTVPFMIDRTLWDIRFMSKKFFDDLKDDFVDDEIQIEIIVGALKNG